MKSESHKKFLHYDQSIECCHSPTQGDLFPDLLLLRNNVDNCGRVASMFIESAGIGYQSKELAIDEVAWAECMKHVNFRACYDLSMAKLSLQQALLSH